MRCEVSRESGRVWEGVCESGRVCVRVGGCVRVGECGTRYVLRCNHHLHRFVWLYNQYH